MLQRIHGSIVPDPERLGSIEPLLECCGIPLRVPLPRHCIE